MGNLNKTKWMSFEVMNMCIYFQSLPVLEHYFKLTKNHKDFFLASMKFVEYVYLTPDSDEITEIVIREKIRNPSLENIEEHIAHMNAKMLEAIWVKCSVGDNILKTVPFSKKYDVFQAISQDRNAVLKKILDTMFDFKNVYLCGSIVYKLLLDDNFQFDLKPSFFPNLCFFVEKKINDEFPDNTADVKKVLLTTLELLTSRKILVAKIGTVEKYYYFDKKTGKTYATLQIQDIHQGINLKTSCNLDNLFVNRSSVYCNIGSLIAIHQKKIFVGQTNLPNQSPFWKMKDIFEFIYMEPLFKKDKMMKEDFSLVSVK